MLDVKYTVQNQTKIYSVNVEELQVVTVLSMLKPSTYSNHF